jgi:hypothetical protein
VHKIYSFGVWRRLCEVAGVGLIVDIKVEKDNSKFIANIYDPSIYDIPTVPYSRSQIFPNFQRPTPRNAPTNRETILIPPL